jgi:hypothetical protein
VTGIETKDIAAVNHHDHHRNEKRMFTKSSVSLTFVVKSPTKIEYSGCLSSLVECLVTNEGLYIYISYFLSMRPPPVAQLSLSCFKECGRTNPL